MFTVAVTSDAAAIDGTVVEYQPERGLVLNTSISGMARVPLSEMAEPGIDVDVARFKEGVVVMCKLVRKARHGCATMTLRQQP